jgi:hypothetical protein
VDQMKITAKQIYFPVSLILAILLFSSWNLFAQYPQFDWAKGAGWYNYDSAHDVAIDKNGNCVIVGKFQSRVTFSDYSFDTNGGYDIFVVKYDPYGKVIWANQIYGPSTDWGYGIKIDADNNIIITRYFTDYAKLGSFNLVSNGYVDILIAKYDSAGNLLWAKTAGGWSIDYGQDLTIDKFNNIYVTGFFRNRALFDSVNIATPAMTYQTFVAKYKATGELIWVKHAVGSNENFGSGITGDDTGNIYVTGAFSDTVTFENITLVSSGDKDVFIVKYDSSGNLLRANQCGGSEYDWGWSVATDGAGNCLVTGQFCGTALFGNITLTSAGGNDIFIAKYDPSGNIIMAKRAGGSSDDQGRDMITDAAGNYYITGEIGMDGTFDGTSLPGNGTIFIVKYDASDNLLWAKRAGSNVNLCPGIALDEPSKSCYIAGYYFNNAVFDSVTLISAGLSDIFVAKLLEQPLPALSAIPDQLDFGRDKDSLTIEIKNMGADTLTWDVIENPHKPWITAIEPGSGINDTIVTVSVNRNQLDNQVDSTTLVINSNGGNQTVSVRIARPADNVPVHWQFVAETGNNATVVLPTGANPNIEGTLLANGDYVGLFNSQGLCCGYSRWEEQNMSITAWGDDDQTPQIDGFIAGELIRYRVYQPNEQKEWMYVEVSYENNIDGQYSANAIMILNQFSAMSSFNISGATRYYYNDNPIVTTGITLDGHQTVTDSAGLFSFTMVPGGNYTLIPSKDGALGSSISAFDASMILRYVVGTTSLTSYQKIAADVSGNGSISALDASYVLRYLVGLITEFPIGDDWTFVPTIFPIDDSNWNTAPESINYMPLNSDQMDQNFYGMIYGDVSGNWTSAGQRLAYKRDTFSRTATVKWGELINLPMDQFTIPILLDLTGEFIAMELTVLFDPQILQLKAIDFSEPVKDFQKEYLLKQGQLIIAMAGDHPISSIDELARLKFQTLPGKNASKTIIELSEIKLNEAMKNINCVNRQISINAALPSTFALHQNCPNPFNPLTTIKYQLSQSAAVTLTVFDLQGQEVRRLVNGSKSAGYYSVSWDGRDSTGKLVATGMYLNRLEVHAADRSIVEVKKMMLMR